jgi:hypothetical protein
MKFVIVMGIILFLLMEHPVAFWAVFVPLTFFFLYYLFLFLRSGTAEGVKHFITAIAFFVTIVIAFLIVCAP